ncbi:hypothetical protein [Acetivibrio clariflavus]|uniref:CAAX protease self-immunity n=1 Tax=Acetivibrio clariflavus (strain DSM 19732 / NBRC 101661 / EBR45) TaxID=720554 RepID=G8M0D2_ACECE|nr:hypothetical protein [Acetivibrio clariflavus]AEV67977.1 hypothetical protein Clocl_1326 [Acetivibrio clariflavus DSM 19732]
MSKANITPQQRKLDIDLWIIGLTTFAVFALYSVFSDQFMSFVKNDNIPVLLRLTVIAALQFGVAGLGISAVCLIRRESFFNFGLKKDNFFISILGTLGCFVPLIVYVFASGQFDGYMPFSSIILTDKLMESGIFLKIVGMLIVIAVWGFFEGFNYVVVSEKISQRYPSKHKLLDWGAVVCAVVCILVHPINISFLGLMEILVTLFAIYGMLIVKKVTGNAWGCIFAFLFVWNAI